MLAALGCGVLCCAVLCRTSRSWNWLILLVWYLRASAAWSSGGTPLPLSATCVQHHHQSRTGALLQPAVQCVVAACMISRGWLLVQLHSLGLCLASLQALCPSLSSTLPGVVRCMQSLDWLCLGPHAANRDQHSADAAAARCMSQQPTAPADQHSAAGRAVAAELAAAARHPPRSVAGHAP